MNTENHIMILIYNTVPSGKHLIGNSSICQHDNDLRKKEIWRTVPEKITRKIGWRIKMVITNTASISQFPSKHADGCIGGHLGFSIFPKGK